MEHQESEFRFPVERRCESSFEHIRRIGTGGFGAVSEVRNKFDGNHYALKKIRVHTCGGKDEDHVNAEVEKVLREAKVLSHISHPNILRYYDCWIEQGTCSDREDDPIGGDESDNRSEGSITSNETTNQMESLSHRKASLEKSLKNVEFINDQEDQPDKLVLVFNEGLAPAREKPTKAEPANCYLIYIQTELCEVTLEDYIRERNSRLRSIKSLGDSRKYQDAWCKYQREAHILLKQILEGMYHLHTKQLLVHRDLKPGNIFVNNMLQVKIADFGLTKQLRWMSTTIESPKGFKLLSPFSFSTDSVNTAAETASDVSLKTLKIRRVYTVNSFENMIDPIMEVNLPTKNNGNALYSSPEQLSMDGLPVDQKTDIWSLGLIILELFYPMNTMMEKTKVFERCRHGELPEEFKQDFPSITEIVQRTINWDPVKRPNIEDLVVCLPRFGRTFQVEMKKSNGKGWKSRMVTSDDEYLYIYSSADHEKPKFIYKLGDFHFTVSNKSEESFVIQANSEKVQNFALKCHDQSFLSSFKLKKLF